MAAKGAWPKILAELALRGLTPDDITYIFISHDLSVVKFMADMMAVMKDGKIIEFGPSEAIYQNPREEYTRTLIEATPCDDLENIRSLVDQRNKQRSGTI